MSKSTRYLLALLALIVLQVQCQSGEFAFDYDVLCNKSFADANATGIQYINPHVGQGQQQYQNNTSGKTEDLGFAYTVTQFNNDSHLAATVWLNVNGANYSDDFGLGYDVCAIDVGPWTYNTNLRGQTDNGSCTTMLDDACVNAITSAAEQYAIDLTLNPTPEPNSNLSSTSLPTVCADIQNMLKANMPKECSIFTNSTTTFSQATALTGYNTSDVYSDCYIIEDHEIWWRILSDYGDYNEYEYSLFTQTVNSILTIWLPIANGARPATISGAKAEMVCVEPNNFSKGSYVPPALPSPTSLSGGGLSGGDIAGIVVGVVVGVAALVAGLVVWWMLSKRRKARKTAATAAGANEGLIHEKDTDIDKGGAAISGAEAGRYYSETSATPIVEAPGDNKRAAELPGQYKSLELDAGKDHEVFESDAKMAAAELEGSAPAR